MRASRIAVLAVVLTSLAVTSACATTQDTPEASFEGVAAAQKYLDAAEPANSDWTNAMVLSKHYKTAPDPEFSATVLLPSGTTLVIKNDGFGGDGPTEEALNSMLSPGDFIELIINDDDNNEYGERLGAGELRVVQKAAVNVGD